MDLDPMHIWDSWIAWSPCGTPDSGSRDIFNSFAGFGVLLLILGCLNDLSYKRSCLVALNFFMLCFVDIHRKLSLFSTEIEGKMQSGCKINKQIKNKVKRTNLRI